MVLSILFFGLIFWKFFSFLSFSDQTIFPEENTKKEKLYPNSPIIQKISAKENNFDQLNVSLSDFSPKIGDKIILEILDELCQSVLVESKIDIYTWHSSNGFKKFKFKTIPNSQGKTYCLKFTYIPVGVEQDDRAYISSFEFEGLSYINTGNKKISGEQKNRSLKLRPAYDKGSHWQNLSILTDRMSQYKPIYLKGESLEIILFSSLFLIMVMGVIIIKI